MTKKAALAEYRKVMESDLPPHLKSLVTKVKEAAEKKKPCVITLTRDECRIIDNFVSQAFSTLGQEGTILWDMAEAISGGRLTFTAHGGEMVGTTPQLEFKSR